MIKNNRVLFGYGTVLVGCYSKAFVEFFLYLTEIKPPQELGARVMDFKEDVEYLEEVHIPMTFDELMVVKNQIKEFPNDNNKIEFKNYILDFSNFHKESVKVIIDAINKGTEMYIRCLAC